MGPLLHALLGSVGPFCCCRLGNNVFDRYSEWDGNAGSMIGASYDWRLAPAQLQSRDSYFSRLMADTEQMVKADPERRPAVVVGFSLGCRIAKFFLHFCHAAKGDEWMKQHIVHFVPLGGPFLGHNTTRIICHCADIAVSKAPGRPPQHIC